ncbi:MAG: putative nucleotidyltransferase substrate binding domain-containing protein [Pseudomonadota bacterium]
MNPDDVISFLKGSPPFQDLDPATIAELANSVVEESYTRGAPVIEPDDPGGTAVRIIKKGAVKVTIPFGRNDETLIDYRGEGDIFGYLALLTGDKLRGEIFFLEDTICYRIERRTVLRLLQRHAGFAKQFFITFLNKYVAKPHRELGKKKLFYGGGDRLLFTTPVGELATRPLITAPEEISIREAAETMTKHQVSSLVLLNVLGFPTGIITNKDLRDKVISKDRDTRQPVKRIQSLSLVKAEAGELCIEALFKMIHYDIHHLLVLDNGRLKGIITTHDLMKLQGASPISIVREIEERQTLEALASPARKSQDLVGHFLQEGVKATHILRIITAIDDRLLGKLLELTQKKLGPPPLPYCFLSLGDSGRQEQAFLSFQNSALIYTDPTTPAQEMEAKNYFLRFSSLAIETLERMDVALATCQGSADTPVWCQSSRSWEKTFFEWIRRKDASSVATSLHFFDYRSLYGEGRLADKLREAIHARLQTDPNFFRAMALSILKTSPPLDASGDFVVEQGGIYSGYFDFERKGIKPLVDVIRLLALENGIRETSSLERLQALQTLSPLIRDYGQELEYSFELIFGLWLQHRHDQVRQGLPAHPFLNPERLNSLEKKALQEAFSLISKVQDLLMEKYQP